MKDSLHQTSNFVVSWFPDSDSLNQTSHNQTSQAILSGSQEPRKKSGKTWFSSWSHGFQIHHLKHQTSHIKHLLAQSLGADLLYSFHVLWRSIDVNGAIRRRHACRHRRTVGAILGNLSVSERFLENAFQNFFNPEGQTVGLGEALDFRFAITRAQNSGELAETVNALIVH